MKKANASEREIRAFLIKIYEEPPVYYQHRNASTKCIEQFYCICNSFKECIATHSPDGIITLQERIDKLLRNIVVHIKQFDLYSDQEKSNIRNLCDIGKKYLEEIAFYLSEDPLNLPENLQLLIAFFYEDQIEECIGGVLSIIQDYYLKFKHCHLTDLQFACLEQIKRDAKAFIDEFDILYFSHESKNNIVRGNIILEHCERHYVNALFNAVAAKFTILKPITDGYLITFPDPRWQEEFAANYTANDILEIYLEYLINSLPQLPQEFDLLQYQAFCRNINAIGADPKFSIYVCTDKYRLHKDATRIIRHSLIKRLIASNVIKLEPFELQHTFESNKTYQIFLIGEPSKRWIEETDAHGERRIITFDKTLPNEFLDLALSARIKIPLLKEALLITAAANNNVFMLDILYMNGCDLNCKDQFGRSLLTIAVLYNSLAFIRRIISLNEKALNSSDSNEYTALMWAAKLNHEEAAAILLAHKETNTESQTSKHATALLIASYYGSDEVLRELIRDPRVNIRAIDRNGNSCLHLAALYNRLSTAEILITHVNINLNQKAHNGFAPLHIVAAAGLNSFMVFLLNIDNAATPLDVNVRDIKNRTPLISALLSNHTTAALSLLDDNRTDIAAKDYRGRTAYEIAKAIDNKIIIERLEELGVADEPPSKRGRCHVQ
jgi:ankyrin repeat protein